MTIRDMKIFLAVCEAQSMSAAAAKLAISQSAVSQSIRQIERHFNTRVFERTGSKVLLTDSGRNLAGCSAHILSYLSHMESLMRSEEQRPLLHTGGFGHMLLVDLVRGYQDMGGPVEPVLHVYPPAQLVSLLSTGVLDVIITDSRPNLPGLVTHYVSTIRAAFICHPNTGLHPALNAEHPVLQLQDLAEIPLLLRDEGNTSRLQFEALMQAHGIGFFCKGVFTSYEGIFSAVDCDLGLGLTTDRTARTNPRRFKQVEVAGADLSHEIFISYLARKESTPGLSDFVSFARDHLSRMYDALETV